MFYLFAIKHCICWVSTHSSKHTQDQNRSGTLKLNKTCSKPSKDILSKTRVYRDSLSHSYPCSVVVGLDSKENCFSRRDTPSSNLDLLPALSSFPSRLNLTQMQEFN